MCNMWAWLTVLCYWRAEVFSGCWGKDTWKKNNL